MSYSYKMYSFFGFFFSRCIDRALSEINGMSQWTLFDLVTLTFDLINILPLDLHTKIQVCMSVRTAGRVRRTRREPQTDRRCQNYYTHHVRDMGCNDIPNEFDVQGHRSKVKVTRSIKVFIEYSGVQCNCPRLSVMISSCDT